MRQGTADQMSAGIAVVSIGAMTRSGSKRRTASRITSSPRASSTDTSCSRSASSAWTRCVMLLYALAISKIRISIPLHGLS